MMAWIRDETAPGGAVAQGTPIVYAGDLNLVGYAQQLETLLSGDIVQTDVYGVGALPDWDGTAWTDALPRQTHDLFTYTWRDDGDGHYPPAASISCSTPMRCCPSSTAEFVLRSEALPADVLAATGMLADDTGIASDHFPVVCDLMATAAAAVDSDGDGLDDADELALGTDLRRRHRWRRPHRRPRGGSSARPILWPPTPTATAVRTARKLSASAADAWATSTRTASSPSPTSSSSSATSATPCP